jgi:hypothetical protein
MKLDREASLSRRTFAKAAVAIGGSAALSACMDRQGDGDGGEPVDIPAGVEDPATLGAAQFVWETGTDDYGNEVPPRHHVMRLLEYTGEGTPSEADREAVETALRTLERAFEWSNHGLVFSIGYSPAYFDRFDADLPDSVDLPEPEALSPSEDPELDDADVVLHLASDNEVALLQAEEALFGNRDQANGVSMEATFDGVLEGPRENSHRRTGFVGAGLPAENAANEDVRGVPDDAPIDEDSPLFMNFKSGFKKNQASIGRVTIQEGPFADGTTKHVSKLRLNLNQWYNQDSREQRVSKMFCPAHAEEGTVEGTGENLGDSSQLDDCIEDPVERASENGVIGHSQKIAADARKDDEPLILRRDFDTTDGDYTGVHFASLQETIEDFVTTKQAMVGEKYAKETSVGRQLNNGIRQYLTTVRRGNFLVPPREHRALPPARP